MDSFKIMVAKSDIDRNTEVITETIMTALYEDNKTLPFYDRVLKVFPELYGKI